MAALNIVTVVAILIYISYVDCNGRGWSMRRYSAEIEDACEKSKSKTLADKDYCHTYYDCSVWTRLKRCSYPKLFSEDTNSCEDFKKVKCGSRKEFKSYCQYFPSSGLCTTTPDCTGYPDGKNIHRNRGAPYYMLCDKGRTIETGQCRSTGIDYSCYVKACTTKIYRRYGAGQCENFIWCYNGTEYKYKCPVGTVFDEKHGKCEHLYYTCKPCGTKSC